MQHVYLSKLTTLQPLYYCK